MAETRRSRDRRHVGLGQSSALTEMLTAFGVVGAGIALYNWGRSSAPGANCCAKLAAAQLDLITCQNHAILGTAQVPTSVGYGVGG